MEQGRLIESLWNPENKVSFAVVYISRYFVEFNCCNLSILDWKVLQRCRYIV